MDWNVQEPYSLRLALRDDLIVRPQEFQGRTQYVIEDPLGTRFFRVGKAEYTLLSLLDGRTTVRDAVGRAATLLGPDAFLEREGLTICRWAVDNQLAYPCGASAPQPLPSERAGRRRSRKPAFPWNLLSLRIPLAAPDRCLDYLSPLAAWLFSWPALCVWGLTLALAAWLAWPSSDELWKSAAIVIAPHNWLWLFVTWLGLKVAHEAGHALACKRFGVSVRQVGVAFLLLSPVAYVDVTPAWQLPSKWRRIVIAAAGMYVELFLAALALIVWVMFPHSYLRWLSSQVFLAAGIHTLLVNANPLVRFDGYQILADWAEIPNLQSLAHQHLLGQLRQLLGGQAPPPSPYRGGWRYFIITYAWLALAWRGLLYGTVAMILLSLREFLGVPLAVALCLAWLVLPVWQMVRFARQTVSGLPLRRRRVAVLATSAAAILAVIGVWWMSPAQLLVPGVVEFAPPHVIRARTSGFVDRVLVSNGDQVRAGEPLLVLDNPELLLEFAELDVKIRQSLVQDKIYRLSQELAKLHIEESNRRSLETKRQELADKLDALTIRAPVAGQVLSRILDQLPGRFLKEGAEVAIVGNPHAKEVLLAIAQDDVKWLASRPNEEVQVLGNSWNEPAMRGRLTRVEPLAREELPHPALAAINGGPVPVVADDQRPQQEGGAAGFRPLRPVFVARVALSDEDALERPTGQRGLVRLSLSQESRGARLLNTVERWIRSQLDSSASN